MTRVEKVLHAGALALALVVLIAACAPQVSAPIGNGERVCRWVRDAVRSGHMTERMAWDWYGHCAPFEVPS